VCREGTAWDVMIMLKLLLQKYCVWSWTRFVWFRLEFNSWSF